MRRHWRLRRPHVASLDQVRIQRRPDGAVIEYADEGVMTVRSTLGPRVAEMTDQEILDVLNDGIKARQELADSYEHIAVEVPVGSTQIEYFEQGDQWTPRGTTYAGWGMRISFVPDNEIHDPPIVEVREPADR